MVSREVSALAHETQDPGFKTVLFYFFCYFSFFEANLTDLKREGRLREAKRATAHSLFPRTVMTTISLALLRVDRKGGLEAVRSSHAAPPPPVKRDGSA